ncbi:MAG TPA: GNAT family N-acetyltransferase [Pyrinomonadaceae bacterium]|nr:GNAT family N-acetyltransferase [Pyrinomonadaceae bacterium]
MDEGLQARQFTLGDLGALLAFLRRVYANDLRRSDRDFWEWHYLKNPLTDSSDLPIWIALDGKRIVGHLAAIETKIKIGEETHKTIWILDLIIDENYRRRGIAKRLVGLAEEFRPIRLGINTHEQKSPELLEARGWKIVASIPRYTRVLFPGNAFLSGSGLKTLVRKAANALYSLRRQAVAKTRPSNGEIGRIERFDDTADRLWENASATRSCIAVRRSEFLNWQYFEQPNKRFEVLGYFYAEKLLGYIVLYFRAPNSHGVIEKAAISDIFFEEAPPETADALVNAALKLAVERRVGRVVTDVLNAQAEAVLRRQGFFRTKSPLLLMVKSDAAKGIALDATQWFVTRGDSDTTIFEESNLDASA